MTFTASDDIGAYEFPEGFIWGAASAAYQIEGAATEDGRGPSIWDTFSHAPGKIRGDDNGDVACDSYHRYEEDVALLAELGLSAYRFSVSWPRIQPGGSGPANEKGLDYYRALVDELVEHSITPVLTLYHWDLPQELEDAGGWTSRDTAERFGEFAAIVGRALGDQVQHVITVNEPQVVAHLGHRLGVHAPGRADPAAAASATHHLLLGHARALAALRAVLRPGSQVGITLNLHPVLLAGDPSGLKEALAAANAELNGLFLEPVIHGRYPRAARSDLLPAPALVRDGDLASIAQPIDFLGVNYYSPVFLRHGDPGDLRAHERATSLAGGRVVEYRPPALTRTPMGWLVDPDALHTLLVRLAREAPGLPLYVTENGCSGIDYVNPDGVVDDRERIAFLRAHLSACARAIADGVVLRGYFVWSLLDNFEWAFGYQQRFGIVFVDFGTGERTVKQSGRFYAEVAAANALVAPASRPRR